jgi:plasmid stabilization system protein ParE
VGQKVSAAKRPQFLLDLAEELIWVKDNAGADVAERWYAALLATIQFISKNPYVGRERKDLTPAGIRSWRMRGFPRWLIFYAVTNTGKVIFHRVRSGTMNLVVLKLES